MTSAACPGCGVVLDDSGGPVHAYMTSSPACWARYGQLLAAQYSNPDRMAFHQLVVDSYAVQHPGGDDPRAVQSVGIHLMTLCLFVERGVDPALGTTLHRRMVERPTFHRLVPSRESAALTVLSVPLDGDAATARAAAFDWATAAWTQWNDHHTVVRGWVDDSGI